MAALEADLQISGFPLNINFGAFGIRNDIRSLPPCCRLLRFPFGFDLQ
jgi:hypothetical protein